MKYIGISSFLIFLFSSSAFAQSVAFEDDFNCVEEDPQGPASYPYGWRNTRPGSNGDWSTVGTDTVYATSDDFPGGVYDDTYEVFLVTGDPSWQDFEIESDITPNDNDSMGLVARYNTGSSWYSCFMTGSGFSNDWPNCSANGGSTGNVGRSRHLRYNGSACVNPPQPDYVIDDDPFVYM